MPIRGVDHIDLAVTDVDRSLAFYIGMLGPIGLAVEGRFQTYRGTEDVVYLGFGQKHIPGGQPETRLGLRRADDGEHHYSISKWGSSTSPSGSTTRAKSTTPISAV